MAKNEWKKVNSDILQILYSVYKKIEQFFFNRTCQKKNTSLLLKLINMIKFIS